MATDRNGRLQEFADLAAAHITGDAKSQSPRPLWERARVRAIDRLFQAYGQNGLLEVGGTGLLNLSIMAIRNHARCNSSNPRTFYCNLQ